jgi:hypothetical protein
MARNWLGVSARVYARMPHVDGGPPRSLWWCGTAERRNKVIAAYLAEYTKKGAKLPKDFKENILVWIDDLTREQNLKQWRKPKTKKFWDLKSYARANGIEPYTFCKWFREMEKQAKELFPDRVPSYRVRRALSEETKEAIRARFLVLKDCTAVAHEFDIEPFRVGQLCVWEKAMIGDAEPEIAETLEVEPVVEDDPSEPPF